MAVPPLDSRNLHRISTELRFLEDTLALQPENKPEHLRAWVVWLRDMDKQWTEYRGILNSVGFQEAPTGELLEREHKVLSRKKEAKIIYDRLRDPNEVLKGPEQPGSAAGSTGEVDYSVMVNDHASSDAEGEPDTTTSAPAEATEKTNGENTQKKENHSEDKVKESPALEENDELQEDELADGVRKRPVPCDLCARRGRSCVGKEGRACLPCKERRVACSHVAKPRKDVTAGTPESDAQAPESRVPHSHSKRPRPSAPEARPVPATGSTGPSAQAGTRTLKRKISRGPAVRGLSTPGGKRVRVDRNEDSEGDPFGSDDEEFMEAARAARTVAGWGEGEGENYAGTLSAEDGVRILDRIRTLEEKARDIVGEISALKTYFLH
ncbi:hypothetical protein EDB84DRAFT_1475869 [Lactarius hengduanensis]|nr:hypothetical protein EDB84DRAFT_1475869 [Lactarius hengduanensis]